MGNWYSGTDVGNLFSGLGGATKFGGFCELDAGSRCWGTDVCNSFSDSFSEFVIEISFVELGDGISFIGSDGGGSLSACDIANCKSVSGAGVWISC